MKEELWKRLRETLDQLSTGYPATDAGVEIEILKSIFTEEEAALFLDLIPFPETPAAAAERLGRDPDELAARMEEMARKGQLMRSRAGGTPSYSIVPFVVGILEFQVKRLAEDAELARKVQEYAARGFIQTLQSLKTPHQRTIPVDRALVVEWPVAAYEDAVAILESQDRIALAPCVCRQMSARTRPEGDRCGKPLDTCLIFGGAAEYYVENGMGRMISAEEAVRVIRKSEEAGLVIQPVNAQKPAGICSCCGDCCGMLLSLKMQPRPGEAAASNYYAEVDASACTACRTCADRCQMDAVEVSGDTAVVLRERCIGCGLCVSTCPTDAVRLVRKPENQLYVPPRTHLDMFIEMAKERGKL